MSRIDNYLQSMERFKANGLVLASDTNVVLKFAAGDRSATQTTSHDQVKEIIREIAPSGSMAAIERGAMSTFFYRRADSSFEVSVSPRGGQWTVNIELAQAELGSAGLGSSPDLGSSGYSMSGSGLTSTPTGSGLSVNDLSASSLSDNALSDNALSDNALSDNALSDNALSDEPLSELGSAPFAARVPAATPLPDPVAPPSMVRQAPASRSGNEAMMGSVALPTPEPGGFERNSEDWVDRILHKMMGSGSSDVHLSSGSEPYWRIDGNIERIPDEGTIEPDFLEKQIRSIAPEENWQEFCECNDTDFAYEVKGLSRFRVNVFRDRKGIGTVMRTIPFEIPSAEDLGLPKAILDMANLSKGLVLVTGPTGSGKSTTLAALIDHINRTRKDHLITIEDPIEFVHPNKMCLVNQREIRRHTTSFKSALRAALREDPDIVLVGEMRDLETIEIAVETAETGHLVFGTLHTTTAPSTVDRIIDQFPTDRQEQIRQMLSTSLKGVVSQVLCRKKGGGRVAAHEILVGTSAVSNLIREAKTFQLFSLMQTGKNLGMVKLEDSLLKLVQAGQVDAMEAYRKANNKQEFSNMLERAGVQLPDS